MIIMSADYMHNGYVISYQRAVYSLTLRGADVTMLANAMIPSPAEAF